MVAEAGSPYEFLGSGFAALGAAAEDTISALRDKERRLSGLLASEDYRRARLLADAWCAAFVWKKASGAPEAVTEDVLIRLHSDPRLVPETTQREIERLASQYRFLHWHLAFPDVFRLPRKGEKPGNEAAGWSGGFDVVLGNPPWEQTELEEKKWFASRRPDIAEAPNAHARKRLIRALQVEDPDLYAAWVGASRSADGERHLLRHSDRYPLCGQGRINSYAVFGETNRLILSPTGRIGCIVPTGIATDDTTKEFFQDLVESLALVSLYDFENAVGLFPGVGHGRYKFSLLTMIGAGSPLRAGAEFVFFAHHVEDLRDDWRRFTLTPEDIALLNPNTHTCPIFRSGRDAKLTCAIYRRVPVLIREGALEENAWGISFSQGLFNMASDSGLFKTQEQLDRESWQREGNSYCHGQDAYLPLYEAKMIHHFDHRFGDYADHPEGAQTTALPDVPAERLADPGYVVQPRYWVPAAEVSDRLEGKWDHGWLLGWRDICRATDERTVIASVIPRVGVGHTTPLMFPAHASPRALASLLANLCAFVLDYSARQKVGGTHLTYGYLNQLPVLPPATYAAPAPWTRDTTLESWLLPRVLELVYTAWDLAPFARDCGHDGSPFRWDEERRFHLRAELDAAFFHLYGISRDDAEYIMDTFLIVRRHDESRHGDYRTKRMILEVYDALKKAMETSESYRTMLDPPPADRGVAHGAASRGRL